MSSERTCRLVTLGSSVSVLVRGEDRPTVRSTFTDVAARELETGGVGWETWNHGRWFERVVDGLDRWERDAAPLSPDVVVLNYGFVDCQTPALPHRLHRASIDWKPAPPPVAVTGALRRQGGTLIRRWTPVLDRLAGDRAHKVSPDRFADVLGTLVRISQRDLGAQVVVLGVSEPGAWLEALMPSIVRRAHRYDEITRSVAADRDASFIDVRAAGIVPVDGIHYDAAGHDRLGRLVASSVKGVL